MKLALGTPLSTLAASCLLDEATETNEQQILKSRLAAGRLLKAVARFASLNAKSEEIGKSHTVLHVRYGSLSPYTLYSQRESNLHYITITTLLILLRNSVSKNAPVDSEQ